MFVTTYLINCISCFFRKRRENLKRTKAIFRCLADSAPSSLSPLSTRESMGARGMMGKWTWLETTFIYTMLTFPITNNIFSYRCTFRSRRLYGKGKFTFNNLATIVSYIYFYLGFPFYWAATCDQDGGWRAKRVESLTVQNLTQSMSLTVESVSPWTALKKNINSFYLTVRHLEQL